MGAVGRSRVQEPPRNTEPFTKSRVRLESKRHTKPNTTHHRIGTRETNTTTNARRSKKTTDPRPGGDDAQSEAADDADDDANFDQHNPSFSKSRVPPREELCGSRTFCSEVRAAAISISSRSCDSDCAIAGGWPNSPPESLILGSALSMVDGEELLKDEEVGEHITPSPSATDSRKSSVSFLHKLVTLFAGCRRSPDKKDSTYHNRGRFKTSSATSDSTFASIEPQRPTSEPDRCLSPPEPLPRLTHRAVIPPVQRFEPAYPSYTEIFPAPTPRDAGRPCSTKDTFTPAIVQRGFDVPNSQTAPVPVHHRRNHLASNLLDRNGDAWAKWHSNHPSPETNPFSRTYLCEDMVPQSTTRPIGPRHVDQQWGDLKCTQEESDEVLSPANQSPEHLAVGPLDEEYSFTQEIYW